MDMIVTPDLEINVQTRDINKLTHGSLLNQ